MKLPAAVCALALAFVSCASDALLALMEYQEKGYALISF